MEEVVKIAWFLIVFVFIISTIIIGLLYLIRPKFWQNFLHRIIQREISITGVESLKFYQRFLEGKWGRILLIVAGVIFTFLGLLFVANALYTLFK